MLERIHIIIQYLLPKKLITYLIGLAATWKGGLITQYMISFFIRIYDINLKECHKKNLNEYKTFNDFFTRKLNINTRPINKNPSILIIPVDGIISQLGKITDNYLFKIKGSVYHLDELLAGHDSIINSFRNGVFTVIYIPPQNCHRVYMPCTGTLREVLYIPGELFSVHPKIIKNIPNILSRNERVICLFDTDFGYMIQILVGAVISGSIETSWLGAITPPRTGIVKHWHYPPPPPAAIITDSNNNICRDKNKSNVVVLSKGEEMGLFKLGSTVINLFINNKVVLHDQLKPNDVVKIGQPLATGYISPSSNNVSL